MTSEEFNEPLPLFWFCCILKRFKFLKYNRLGYGWKAVKDTQSIHELSESSMVQTVSAWCYMRIGNHWGFSSIRSACVECTAVAVKSDHIAFLCKKHRNAILTKNLPLIRKICSNVIRSIKKKRTKLCGVLWDSTTVCLSAVFTISKIVSVLYLNGAVCLWVWNGNRYSLGIHRSGFFWLIFRFSQRSKATNLLLTNYYCFSELWCKTICGNLVLCLWLNVKTIACRLKEIIFSCSFLDVHASFESEKQLRDLNNILFYASKHVW